MFEHLKHASKLPEFAAYNMVTEAIRSSDFSKAGSIILQYFKRNGFSGAYKMPGVEEFKNSFEHGVGIRYFVGGLKSIRLNWAYGSNGSSSVVSADLWTGSGDKTGADMHVKFDKNMSLVKVLPAIVAVMKNPVVGSDQFVFESMNSTNLVEAAAAVMLNENSINVSLDVAEKFVSQLSDGKKVSELTKVFGGPGYRILDKLKELYPNNFEKQGVAFFFRGSNSNIDIAKVLGSAGGIRAEVLKGSSSETIIPSAEEKKLEADSERLVFEEQLKDLRSVIQLVIRGASNSCIVFGRGGCLAPETLVNLED